MAAYNIPLFQGGYVSSNEDDGWDFVTAAIHTANAQNFRVNYN